MTPAGANISIISGQQDAARQSPCSNPSRKERILTGSNFRMKPSFYVISFIGFLGVVLGAPQRKSALALIFAAIFLSLIAIGVRVGYPIAPSIVIAFASIY